jgi:hypothetical protein
LNVFCFCLLAPLSRETLRRMSQSALDYEEEVRSCLVASGHSQEERTEAVGGYSSEDVDGMFHWQGRRYNLEIKKDVGAQMGGTSVRFDASSGVFLPATHLAGDIWELIEPVLVDHCENLRLLCSFLGPDVSGFPCHVPRATWDAAQSFGLLVNAKVTYETAWIHQHYAKKDTYYIQIGSAGLFYLQSNPANLPIPQLTGSLTVELRTGRSGSKLSRDGSRTVGSGIRAQGRLRVVRGLRSNYSLDDEASIRSLFQTAAARAGVRSGGGS